MGVRIWHDGEKRETVTMFYCDGDHGLFPAPTIQSSADYKTAHHSFIAAGWSETPERVLCPECK